MAAAPARTPTSQNVTGMTTVARFLVMVFGYTLLGGFSIVMAIGGVWFLLGAFSGAQDVYALVIYLGFGGLLLLGGLLRLSVLVGGATDWAGRVRDKSDPRVNALGRLVLPYWDVRKKDRPVTPSAG